MQTMTIENLRQLPAFAAMLADAESAALEKRKAEIDAWRDADQEGRQRIAELTQVERERSSTVDALAAKLKAATHELDAARMALMDAANRHHYACEEGRQRIAAGADSRLPNFIVWVRHADNLAGFASHRAGYLGFAGAVPPDRQTRMARQAAKVGELCDFAAERAEGMRLEAIRESDLTGELAAMAGAIRDAFEPLAEFAPVSLPADYMSQ